MSERKCHRCKRRKERAEYITTLLDNLTGQEQDALCVMTTRGTVLFRLREVLMNAALRIDP